MITFSTLNRLEVCPGSYHLPQVDTASEHASRGTARHAYLAALTHGVDPGAALEAVPEEHRAECDRIDLEGLPLGRAEAEVAFALNPETGEARRLGRELGRRYEITDGEIAGTVDVLRPAYVGDYKGEHDDTPPPPADNLQLLAGAVAADVVMGWGEATVELIHLREDGSHWREAADLDAIALGAALLRIRDVVRKVRAASPDRVTRSEHCRWCPAFAACPATLALARRLAESPEAVGEEARGLLTVQAGHALQLVRLARKVLDTVEAEVREFARVEGPIPLPGGKVYGPRQVERIRTGPALRLVRELFGEDAEDAARKVSTSKAAIERAVGRDGARTVLERLRERGELDQAEEWRDVRAGSEA